MTEPVRADPPIPAGAPAMVWLASYPKSGNTWFRTVWGAAIREDASDPLARIAMGRQPHQVYHFARSLGFDPRYLTPAEADRLRARDHGRPRPRLRPVPRKTHEMWRRDDTGLPVFPLEITRAAIYLIRDPRDVACSLAPHQGISLPEAVAMMGTAGLVWGGRSSEGTSHQILGSWSENVRSWLQPLPFPVLRLRYEDLKADPLTWFERALTFAGLPVSRADVERAVAETDFERLQQAEAEKGFRELPDRATAPFFRRGVAGGWRDELPADLARRIEEDHGDVMREHGYQPEMRATGP